MYTYFSASYTHSACNLYIHVFQVFFISVELQVLWHILHKNCYCLIIYYYSYLIWHTVPQAWLRRAMSHGWGQIIINLTLPFNQHFLIFCFQDKYWPKKRLHSLSKLFFEQSCILGMELLSGLSMLLLIVS